MMKMNHVCQTYVLELFFFFFFFFFVCVCVCGGGGGGSRFLHENIWFLIFV